MSVESNIKRFFGVDLYFYDLIEEGVPGIFSRIASIMIDLLLSINADMQAVVFQLLSPYDLPLQHLIYKLREFRLPIVSLNWETDGDYPFWFEEDQFRCARFVQYAKQLIAQKGTLKGLKMALSFLSITFDHLDTVDTQDTFDIMGMLLDSSNDIEEPVLFDTYGANTVRYYVMYGASGPSLLPGDFGNSVINMIFTVINWCSPINYRCRYINYNENWYENPLL